MKTTTQTMLRSTIMGLMCVLLVSVSLQTAWAQSTIDAIHQYAWSENTGWHNWRATAGQVSVEDTHLTGYVWAENIGWIKLGATPSGTPLSYANTDNTNWGVNKDNSTGALSGYAWSENAGWINFKPTNGGVSIDPATGKFDGYAWGENIGWIHFQNASPAYRVQTSAAPTVTTQAATSVGTTTATGNGTLTALGTSALTAHGVCWSTTANPTLAGTCSNLGSANTTGAFSAAISGLSANTTYHVRAFATNSTGTAYGADQTFTTLAAPVNGTCGSDHNQALTATPTNLCSAGTASTVSGSGPWTWSCAGSGGGTTDSCSAGLKTWSVTGSAGAGGSISPASQTVNHGTTATFAIAPDAGYGITGASSGCGGSLSGSLYTISAVTGNCTVSATFSQNAVSGVCGSDHGQALSATPNALCDTGTASAVTGTGPWSWTCAGTGGGAPASCAATTSHTVTASAGEGGTISPASRTVNHGGVTSFTVTPDEGFAIGTVSGCGGSLNGNLFTTGAVNAACTVSATFAATNTTTTITSVTPSPSKIGEAVTVNFSVTSTVTGFNGTVTVSDQDGTTCSSAITTVGTNATGSCQLTFAAAGAKTLIASYRGF